MKCSIILVATFLTLVACACTSYQEEDAPVGLNIKRDELSFPQSGGGQSFTISSGTKWDVSSLPSWITLSTINRSNISTYEWEVTLSASANDEYNRDGIITIKTKTETVDVSVMQDGKKGKYVAVESVSVSPTELTLRDGESASLSFVITPLNASNKDVTWKSSNSSVATVSQTGQVNAVAEGTTIITVTTEDDNKTATCSVTVNPVSVSSVSLDKESLTLKIGESSTLIATVLPENAANKTVTWSSSNTSIATVDSDGKVMALEIGSANITVTTEDGGKKAVCQVLVKEPLRATSLALLGADFLYSARVGKEYSISLDVKPEDALVDLEWSVSDESLAEISGEGRSITLRAKDYGPSTLMVRDKISGLSASEQMKAGLLDFYWTENTGKTFNGCPLVEIEVGEKRQLSCYYKPEYATRVFRLDMNGFRYYEPLGDNTEISDIPHNNPSFFSIDENGTITGEKEGLTKICVYSPIILNNAQDLYVRVSNTQHVPEAVDLGLSVKWSSFDLDASAFGSIGPSYDWGDISSEHNWSWSQYKWCEGTENTLTKYNVNKDFGLVDNLITIDLSDDAANVKLGGKWRIPNSSEWEELHNECTWTWTTLNGRSGVKVQGKNGNWIFLPYSNGWGYWGANLSADNNYSTKAYNLYFNYVSERTFVYSAGSPRISPCRIRPVYGDLKPEKVVDVSLNKTTLYMKPEETYVLSSTVIPANATNGSVVWYSNNTSVATVSSSGLVTAKSNGTALITVTTNDGGKTASCQVIVNDINPTIPVPEVIDMGLSVKWASFNIGASKPEEYGDYYAWGETVTKSNYCWSTYIFGTSESGPFSKYNTNVSYGTVDNIVKLELGPYGDDVASKKLGGKWRMPTGDEWSELNSKCTWVWATRNGVNGYQVTATNGNSIFLPAAGYRDGTNLAFEGRSADFWSSSLYTDNPRSSMYLGVSSDLVLPGVSYRYYGFSVRPVTE